ncbi:Deoxyuridine 5'-triphosphate nucleotidohydrolase [Zalerion maritima]|uniref:Deoxyuridine 5'-triphosphate nucleotidohydrolase n=1 Tax=Zalerion maritima TaxID=339359 RepID=A0AAD5WSC8_9PEZI|nr:Deoxyuridine 5'-triphosphate nucleotidohydrolase [Zalerion maritima]
MSTTPPPAAPAAVASSPPVSPPPKRQKTQPSSPSQPPPRQSASIAGVIETSVLPGPVPAPAMPASELPPLQVKKLAPAAKLPARGSAFAAGYDLFASRDANVPAKGKALVDTDISMSCPAGTSPRSGLASKHFIDTGAGVIDCDYRGPVKVLLFNHSENDFAVREGDRIAQLVLERIVNPEVVEVEELEESVRGAGGFGSTGTN